MTQRLPEYADRHTLPPMNQTSRSPSASLIPTTEANRRFAGRSAPRALAALFAPESTFYARSKTVKSNFLIPALLAAVTLSTSAFARDGHDHDDQRDHRRWEEQRRDHARWEEERRQHARWEDEQRRWEEQRREERREHWRRRHHHDDYQRAYAPPPPRPSHYYAEPVTIQVPLPPLILPPSPREVERTVRDLLHGR